MSQAAQAVTFRLPDDVARQVGDFTVDATCLPRDELCACRTERQMARRLGEVPRVALVSCDSCGKWRKVPAWTAKSLGDDDKWHCADHPDGAFASCDVPEEKYE